MKKESLKEKAYFMIKGKIISTQYPPNHFLDESQLVEEIGASRTPIREALNKLEQENLVRIIPKRGVLVCDLTLGEVNGVYEVRMLVEPYIIRTNAHTIAREQLLAARGEILNDCDQLTSQEVYESDNKLHQLLIDSSNNPYLLEMMGKIFDQNHRIRILSGQTVERRLEDTKEEHIHIFNCLLEGDMEGAALSMLVHLEKSKKAAVDAMLMTSFPIKNASR